MIKLDILSDPICPWCYIGKANLDRVLQERPGHPFDIEWHPFQLNPDMPEGGMDRRDYLEAKFGGREGAVKAYAPVVEAAQAAGLDIAFDKIAVTPNTLSAHCMIHWAGLEGRQMAMVAALFHAYFIAGQDIGSRDVLLGLAGDVGLDRGFIERLMDSGADRDEIAARDAHARARGVTGVPTFIIANQHAVPGAQPPELWNRVLDDLERQAAEAPE
ncbi:DsbA family oxidoreductase [Maribius pontilimi]|uniref:DsbA family oxidoreductase n=1 Tax=Palleronia pontilimi TaxID=1964209 RepID=A0A934II27_9RHOB|nr:DsbA family oxidoreductase [Palleronia pontilimi]MBJ3762965.1 DsbA family oxidoreductase [Palleronia pontilimi]